MTRTEDSNNYYIYCGKCNTLLGCELKNIPDEDEPEINNNSIYEYNYYLLKKNIKERNNRTITINLISFKENLLKTINSELNNIFKDLSNVHIQINNTPLTKEENKYIISSINKNQNIIKCINFTPNKMMCLIEKDESLSFEILSIICRTSLNE